MTFKYWMILSKSCSILVSRWCWAANCRSWVERVTFAVASLMWLYPAFPVPWVWLCPRRFVFPVGWMCQSQCTFPVLGTIFCLHWRWAHRRVGLSLVVVLSRVGWLDWFVPVAETWCFLLGSASKNWKCQLCAGDDCVAFLNWVSDSNDRPVVF